MSELFAERYPVTDEGMARMRLAQIAAEIELRHGRLDPDERMHLVVLMHRVVRDDLPDDLRPLYDELRTHLAME